MGWGAGVMEGLNWQLAVNIIGSVAMFACVRWSVCIASILRIPSMSAATVQWTCGVHAISPFAWGRGEGR